MCSENVAWKKQGNLTEGSTARRSKRDRTGSRTWPCMRVRSPALHGVSGAPPRVSPEHLRCDPSKTKHTCKKSAIVKGWGKPLYAQGPKFNTRSCQLLPPTSTSWKPLSTGIPQTSLCRKAEVTDCLCLRFSGTCGIFSHLRLRKSRISHH